MCSSDLRGDQSTYGIITRGLTEGEWPAESLRRIAERTSDGFRVLTLCLFVAAISAFPSGRRKEPVLPVEIAVLGVVLLERAVTSYAPVAGWARETSGVIVLIMLSVAILLYRLRVFAPLPREVHSR